jgi:lysine 6-dehydrogenase
MVYLVLGAGRQGTAIAHDLTEFGTSDSVVIVDRDSNAVDAALRRLGGKAVEGRQMDFSDMSDPTLDTLFRGAHVCVSALPYFYNLELAKRAIANGVHFCDLGGNTDIVMQELALDASARSRGVHVIPDCGLSPGMTNILAAHVISKLERVDTVEIRVGGLPRFPVPPLRYQLLFSVHGLLNEYLEPAIIFERGELKRVQSLTHVETVSFEGYPDLEAFYTFGGISTMPYSLGASVPNMNEKTVRYRGHAAEMNAILGDSRFRTRQELADHLESVLPKSGEDVVLVRVSAIGTGRAECELIDYFDLQTGFSAMMRTTGFSAAIVARMMADGTLSNCGAHTQERVIPTESFIHELGRRNIRVEQKIASRN